MNLLSPILALLLLLQFQLILALPGKTKQMQKKGLNGGKVKKMIRHWPFGRSSFVAESFPHRKGDYVFGTIGKIEKGLEKLNLPTNKHDMRNGYLGKVEEKVIRIKEPGWYIPENVKLESSI